MRDVPVEVREFDLSPAFDKALREERVSAWDIETTGLDFRLDQIRTCQVYVPNVGVEIVKLYGDVPERLRDVLMSETVFKVFHHAPFDLRFMRHHWKAQARNVGCTKVLSKLINPESDKHSLKDLVSSRLGLELDKSERLSDWGAEVLTAEQVDYASNDVLYLLPLLQTMWKEALNLGLGDALEHSFDYLPTRVETDLRDSGDVFAY